MKILLISPFFAPENQIASHRITSFARYWAEAGHEVTVLTREPAFLGMDALTTDGVSTIRVKDRLAKAAQKGIANTRSFKTNKLRGGSLALLQRLVKFALFPDRYIFWSLAAKRKLRNLQISPDVIVTSVGPLSTLLVGKYAASKFCAPLVIDYRDLLVESMSNTPAVRTWLSSKIERRGVASAELLVAVTSPMCVELANRFSTAPVLVMNGFEPESFSAFKHAPSSDVFRIVYAGTIYPGRRDPSMLFEAVATLLQNDPGITIAIDFYGNSSPEVEANARKYGVSEYVNFYGNVSHSEAVQAQVNADLLLLLMWNDESQKGVLTGKLFEYIGAQRPILCLGLDEGAAPDLIRENSLGESLTSHTEIVEYLYSLISAKRDGRLVKKSANMAVTQFTRQTQSQIFLDSLLRLTSKS